MAPLRRRAWLCRSLLWNGRAPLGATRIAPRHAIDRGGSPQRLCGPQRDRIIAPTSDRLQDRYDSGSVEQDQRQIRELPLDQPASSHRGPIVHERGDVGFFAMVRPSVYDHRRGEWEEVAVLVLRASRARRLRHDRVRRRRLQTGRRACLPALLAGSARGGRHGQAEPSHG